MHALSIAFMRWYQGEVRCAYAELNLLLDKFLAFIRYVDKITLNPR